MDLRDDTVDIPVVTSWKEAAEVLYRMEKEVKELKLRLQRLEERKHETKTNTPHKANYIRSPTERMSTRQ